MYNLVFFEFISSPESQYTSNLVMLRNRPIEAWISIQGTAFIDSSSGTNPQQWEDGQGHYWI